MRVEREPAEDWPQLVCRCNELNVGAHELGLDQSLDEELSVIAASKQHSRYKQKRRKKLRQQVLRAIAAAEVVGLHFRPTVLRIANIKNMGRDLAPEQLRICP